jgi:hypothetical protein
MEKPSWEIAADFFNRVRESVASVDKEQLEVELKKRTEDAIEGGLAQTPNPTDVLVDLIFRESKEMGPFEIVSGVLGVQPHRWYEWSYLDKAVDPLPQRFIVDPVPLGSYSRPVGWLPNSPFVVLYIKDIDRSKEENQK